LGPQFYWNNDL
jgi:hypothetical protein